jgi:DNA-binding MarR family transcriptional regulator/GNAT superfamily N-acetyltransferase
MTMTSMAVLDDRIAVIRRFNRLYTGKLGLLAPTHLDSAFSLTEARLLYELAQEPAVTAKDLCDRLGLDQGYVSRILARFQNQGLITRRASKKDGRVQQIALTAAGQKTYAGLDRSQRDVIADLLRHRPEAQQRAVTAAADSLVRLLGDAPPGPVVIRSPRSGDLGWIIHRHGTAIAAEFGWNAGFEACIAEILGQFGRHPGREAGFVAERDGDILGSVFVMSESGDVARLRVLYVEAAARGLGLGARLVALAIGFARDSGYRTLRLWTHEFQAPARKIYQQAGFRLVASQPTVSFGVKAVSETWEIALTPRCS